MNVSRFVESLFGTTQLSPVQLALLSAGTFVAISLVTFLVGKLLFGVGRNRLPESEQVGSRRPLALGAMTEAFAKIIPLRSATRERLQLELHQAGYYHRRALAEFLGVRNAALVGWLILVGVAVVMLADPRETLTPKLLLAGAVFMLVIFGVPRLVLHSQAQNRCRRIQFALPDSLDMITMMVTGGLPLRDAIKRAAKELKYTYPDIACELGVIELQTDAGSMDLALRQFAKRLDIPDVTALASMVRHAERIGGQVSAAFREFADSIRKSRRQRAEERGNKSSVKLLFPIVMFLAPPIYILLLGPAGLELKEFVQRQRQPGGALEQNTASALQQARQSNSPGSARVGRGPLSGPGDSASSQPAAPAPALPSVLRNRVQP